MKMKIIDIIGVAAAIITSLGGGAIIITATAKWFGDFLAQKLLANVEHRHEKEIEQYKANLQDMSTRFTAVVEHSMQVASKQYDMELKIYQDIWKALHELSICLKYIYDFMHPISSGPQEYLELLRNHQEDFQKRLDCFHQQIDSVAPFYQGEIYDLLHQLEDRYVRLLQICQVSVCIKGMSYENSGLVENDILPDISELKEKLALTIRNYLFSLQQIPNNSG